MISPEPIWAIGCMSGTSMDGVDAASVLTDGHEILGFGPTRYRPYDNDEREAIRSAKGCWPGCRQVEDAEAVIIKAHEEILGEFQECELVGFHGHTLAHDPKNRRTHQAGSGQQLADAAGKKVVWDFRTEDMRMGGEGAPLAPFFHFALAQHAGLADPAVFLNIGGVANISWVDTRKIHPEETDALLAFDVGPGNSILDDFVRVHTGQEFDEGGKLASGGKASPEIVDEFLENPFFVQRPPKSLDRDEFSHLLSLVGNIEPKDACATLAECVVRGIVEGCARVPSEPSCIAVCGGGRKNAALMLGLSKSLKPKIRPVEAYGLDGDMIEAQAFAFLAVRVLNGLPTSSPTTTGCRAPVVGGRISEPINTGVSEIM